VAFFISMHPCNRVSGHPLLLRMHPSLSRSLFPALSHRNRELGELFEHGFGMHHAGMLRPDRSLTERMFSDGVIKVGWVGGCDCEDEMIPHKVMTGDAPLTCSLAVSLDDTSRWMPQWGM
jgi:hypothetical protein